MGNELKELETIQGKLRASEEKMRTVIEKLTRLQEQIAPLGKQMADAQVEQKYLQGRIEKLTKILSGL
jgi:chromosome segregation ATPase